VSSAVNRHALESLRNLQAAYKVDASQLVTHLTTKGVAPVNVSRTIFTPAAIIVGLCFAGCGGTDSPAAPTNEATPGVSTQSQVAGPGAQTPSAFSANHAGFMRALHGINLSDQQRSQIMQLMQQYRQAHPRGSAIDPQARQQLTQAVSNVLTPQQRTQFEQNLAQPRDGGMLALGLSAQQETRIRQLMQQFHQTHPQGSAADPQARQALHQQILAILTPQQQAQWKQHMQSWHGRGAMRGITLSDQQKSQIKALVEQFRQGHASGTAIDPQARQELQQQILKILTPQQQAQYQQNLQQVRHRFD
jgi:Spy/CpxP family protein refolding chaperone